MNASDVSQVQDVTRSHMGEIGVYVDKVTVWFFWILFVLCMVGNPLNVKVLFDRAKKGWLLVEILLCVVSVSDMVGMLFAAGYYFNSHFPILQIPYEHVNPSLGAVMWGQSTFMMFSDFILIGVSAVRLRDSARWTLRRPERKRYSENKKLVVGLSTAGVLFLCGSLSLEPMLDHYHPNFLNCSSTEYNSTDDGACVWILHFKAASSYAQLILTPVTLVAIALLNFCLCAKARRKQDESIRFRRSVSQSAPARSDLSGQMAVGSVMLYFLTQTPVFIYNLLDHPSTRNLIEVNMPWRTAFENLVNQWSLVNYSCDFLVYIGSSRPFREALQKSLQSRGQRGRKESRPLNQPADTWVSHRHSRQLAKVLSLTSNTSGVSDSSQNTVLSELLV